MHKTNIITKIITVFAFLLMIVVNEYANVVGINGKTIIQIFHAYPNLYSPAKYTYYIWLFVYILLAGFALYQLGLFGQNKSRLIMEKIQKIRILFIVVASLSIIWSIAFHYEFFALSLMLLIIIFMCLSLIVKIASTEEMNKRDKLLIKFPFSIYCGWSLITAVITVIILFVSFDFNGYGISDSIWTIIFLVISTSISLVIMLKCNNIVYGLTIVWAYIGILVKHLSNSGFKGQYPEIIISTTICTILLIILSVYLFLIKIRRM